MLLLYCYTYTGARRLEVVGDLLRMCSGLRDLRPVGTTRMRRREREQFSTKIGKLKAN